MMYRLSVRTAYALSASVLIAASASAQDRFATSVVQYNQGGGTGLFNTGLILGGPQGGGFSGGSLDVLTLGTGGDVTLGFDVTITNGPGADFTVFENGFVFSETVFAEVAMVEVSTDGTTFARFPTRYNGDPGPLGGFALLPYATYEGLTGGLPGLANVLTNQVDPFNPVVSGGEAFDLAELVGQAEVVSGSVDLAAIHFVRIVDVIGGTINDSTGTPIWDSGGDSGADIDAVAVIHHLGRPAPPPTSTSTRRASATSCSATRTASATWTSRRCRSRWTSSRSASPRCGASLRSSRVARARFTSCLSSRSQVGPSRLSWPSRSTILADSSRQIRSRCTPS